MVSILVPFLVAILAIVNKINVIKNIDNEYTEFTLPPEQLFDAEHTSIRKREFGIEDWRFGQ